MAYGDGGFFFTQPVGNGYSGLGALGSTRPFHITPAVQEGSSPVLSMRRVVPSDDPSTLGPPGSLSPMPMLTTEEAQTIGLMSPNGADALVETSSSGVLSDVKNYLRHNKNMLVAVAVATGIVLAVRHAGKKGMFQ